MKFMIQWREAALDDLAAAWLNADTAQRALITKAADSIEQSLKFYPRQKGESRPDGERILFDPPVAVLFHVEEEDRLVMVEQAWIYYKR